MDTTSGMTERNPCHHTQRHETNTSNRQAVDGYEDIEPAKVKQRMQQETQSNESVGQE